PVTLIIGKLDVGGFEPRPTGPDAYESHCPAHAGSRRNLTIRRGDDGRALIHCHHETACPPEAVVEALGLTMGDLFASDGLPSIPLPPAKGKTQAKSGARAHRTPEAALAGPIRQHGQPTAHWVYHAADGAESFRVYRFDFTDAEGEPDK